MSAGSRWETRVSRSAFRAMLLVLALAVAWLPPCRASEPTAEPQAVGHGVRRRLSPPPRELPIAAITRIRINAGRGEWSPDDRFITFHSRGSDGYYDVYVTNSDGSDARCLTCDLPSLPGKHAGQASWHPSGEWLVFQAEKSEHVLPRVAPLAAPGIGFHNDLWVMRLSDRRAYRLTDLETKDSLADRDPTSAVLQPHFSNDGRKLSWSERIDDGGTWGRWVIRVADFVIDDNIPSVESLRTLTPGANRQYYESNDFLPGDRHLLVCGNLEPGQTELGIDIYVLDLETGVTERLTHTPDVFDECPHPSPDGSQIAYLSTEGFEGDGGWQGRAWWRWARGEFWVMDRDGANKTRLTYFNEPGYPEYTSRRVIPAYVSWNAAGDKLLLGVAVETTTGLEDELYLVELKR
jgi:Tol biopolymer transport system component